jgi:hypothetical protein
VAVDYLFSIVSSVISDVYVVLNTLYLYDYVTSVLISC